MARTEVEAIMSSKAIYTSAAFIATAAALAAPFLLADQKPDGSRTGYAEARSEGELHLPPGSTGWGKGSIVMPVRDQLGMLVGVLTDCDAVDKYMLQGELTGFMPSTGLSGGAEYWFGGMYGKMQKVATSEPAPGKDDVQWFEVEGMWVLDKHYQGSFSAQLLDRNAAGTAYVCGVIDGRFKVSDAMPGPAPAPDSQGMTFKFFDDRKGVQKPKVATGALADRASEGETITCPKGDDPVVEARGAKPPFLVTIQDAGATGRAKSGGGRYEEPCSAGWRDLRSTLPPYSTPETPTWPVLMGGFDLRYRLYE